MNLRIILAISLLALVAAVAVTATFPTRESSAPTGDAGSSGLADAEQVQRAWPDHFGSTVELTQEEQILLAEIQRNHDPETLDQYLNPLTFAEEEQRNRFGNPSNARSVVESTYDRIFPDFVDGLGLSPEEAALVRDAWIDHEIRKSELGGALIEGLNSSGEVAGALSDANQRFQTRLSRVLSPEQIAAMREHERQVDMDFMAQVEAGLQEKAEQGITGIVAASSGNNLASVQAYLASGADPNQLSESGFSAMHNAAANNDTEMLRALIEAGGDVNLTNPDGPSALYVAAGMGRTETVRVLVEAGADVNYSWNSNPLSNALNAAARSGSTDTVRVLLEAGADATGWTGASALERAIQFGDREMERMLIEAGADADDPSVVSQRKLFDLGRKLGLVRER